jgi:serine/threonine-protein kinase
MDVTPEYIAPEVATGGTPGEATDLYGLGLLLFEMISGAPPFADASVSGVLDRIVNEPTPPLPPAAPTALQALIEALLAKHPSRRPANAGDVAETLARIARGGAAQASGR